MKKCILILLILSHVHHTSAQDNLFSQYFASQPYLNPAMTGFFDGSYRINAQFRNQWATVSPGISTYGVSADMKLAKDIEGDYIGIGLCAYRDDIFGRYVNNSGRVNISYTKKMGYDILHFLSIGASGGFDMNQVSKNNLITSDNIDESFQRTSMFVPNFGLGLNYQIVFPSTVNVFFGGAVDHLLSDKNSTFNNNVTIEKKYTIYTSARLRADENVYILPTVLAAQQGIHRQINVGTSAQLLMRDYYVNKTNFQLGVYSRFSNQSIDAIIGLIRYETRGFQIGLSYDHNLSEYNSATKGYGALELSLGYIGLFQREYKSRTECPNLKNF